MACNPKSSLPELPELIVIVIVIPSSLPPGSTAPPPPTPTLVMSSLLYPPLTHQSQSLISNTPHAYCLPKTQHHSSPFPHGEVRTLASSSSCTTPRPVTCGPSRVVVVVGETSAPTSSTCSAHEGNKRLSGAEQWPWAPFAKKVRETPWTCALFGVGEGGHIIRVIHAALGHAADKQRTRAMAGHACNDQTRRPAAAPRHTHNRSETNRRDKQSTALVPNESRQAEWISRRRSGKACRLGAFRKKNRHSETVTHTYRSAPPPLTPHRRWEGRSHAAMYSGRRSGPYLTLVSGTPVAAGCEGTLLPEVAGCGPFPCRRSPDVAHSRAGGRRMWPIPVLEAAGCERCWAVGFQSITHNSTPNPCRRRRSPGVPHTLPGTSISLSGSVVFALLEGAGCGPNFCQRLAKVATIVAGD